MPLSNTPIKAAIFDIGATLVTGPPVAPNKVIAGIIGAQASDIGSVIMTTELLSDEHAFQVLQDKFGVLSERAKRQISELWQAQRSAPVEIDGASKTVLAAKNAGLKIGLLSDIWNPYYFGVEIAIPDVIECANAIVLSCRTGFRKPEKANFHKILDELLLSPEECVMIGDTYTHDILPAIGLGMQTIWVLARPDRERESILEILNNKAPAPSITVSDIREVEAAITCINIFSEVN